MSKICICLPSDMIADIRRIAGLATAERAKVVSTSSVVRAAMERYLKERKAGESR